MIPYSKLNKRVVSLWRIHALIATVVIGVVLIVPSFLLSYFAGLSATLHVIAIVITVVYFLIFAVLLPEIRFRRWRYRITDDAVALHRGILIVTDTIVPMIKIQYTDTSHGPIMRALRLAEVSIMTAGGTEEIPGLPPEEATAMVARITELVKLVKEEV